MNMHISSLAALPRLLAFCSSAIASMPKGVAALPRPRKLAARLSVMGAMASDESGMSRFSRGRAARLSFSISPASLATFISPSHSMKEGQRARQSSKASDTPESMASTEAAGSPDKAKAPKPHSIRKPQM